MDSRLTSMSYCSLGSVASSEAWLFAGTYRQLIYQGLYLPEYHLPYPICPPDASLGRKYGSYQLANAQKSGTLNLKGKEVLIDGHTTCHR